MGLMMTEISNRDVDSLKMGSVEVTETLELDEIEEIDSEFSCILDNVYDRYLKENGIKIEENEDSEGYEKDMEDNTENEFERGKLESELDQRYDSYLNDALNWSEPEKKGAEAKINNPFDVNDDLFDNELDGHYNRYVQEGERSSQKKQRMMDDVESDLRRIKCRNENLEGGRHPETGVPFEKRQVAVDGKEYEVVIPKFESRYDAQLPENKLKSTDREQFEECNIQLKDELSRNSELRGKFDEEQLEQIDNGDTPDGYTWHHDADVGKMQLVDTEMHQRTGHTGGRFIWGGGADGR